MTVKKHFVVLLAGAFVEGKEFFKICFHNF